MRRSVSVGGVTGATRHGRARSRAGARAGASVAARMRVMRMDQRRSSSIGHASGMWVGRGREAGTAVVRGRVTGRRPQQRCRPARSRSCPRTRRRWPNPRAALLTPAPCASAPRMTRWVAVAGVWAAGAARRCWASAPCRPARPATPSRAGSRRTLPRWLLPARWSWCRGATRRRAPCRLGSRMSGQRGRLPRQSQ